MEPQKVTAKNMTTGIMLIFLTIFFSSCSSDVNYTPPANSPDTAINHYSFGKMIVDGKTYEHDLLIFPDKTVKGFKPEINHFIKLSDIQPLIDASNKNLIIGIGSRNRCEVSQDVIDYAASKGVTLHINNTYEAVKLFNSISKKGLGACFHLNC